MVRVDRKEIKPEYNQDPESLQGGDDLEGHHNFCGICLYQIYAPILQGIWYHRDTYGHEDHHEPVPADNFMSLFLTLKAFGNMEEQEDRYSDESKECNCIDKWYQLLRKDIERGFYGEYDEGHYYDEKGITICKQHRLPLQTHDVGEPNYPEKQSYNCEECLAILEKRKMIKITPNGKSNGKLWNTIEWLRKEW